MNKIKMKLKLQLLAIKEKYKGLFCLTEKEEIALLKITSNKAVIALKYFAMLAIVIQLFNIFRVLVLSSVKLGSFKNRIYFTLYLSLLVVAILTTKLQRKNRGDYEKINKISTYATVFWILWMLLINSYDAYHSQNFDSTIYVAGILGASIIIQLKPRKVFYIYTSSFLLFIIINYQLLDIGIIINVGAAMILASLSSILIYVYTIRDMKQENKILDITEQLRLDYEKLRLSNEKYEIVLRESNEGIFDWDFENDKITFSADLVQIFQYKQVVHGVNKWIEEESQIHSNDKQKIIDMVAYAYREKKNCEMEFYHKGETEVYKCYLLKLILQYNAESYPVNAIGVLSDISHHKRIISNLEQQAEKDLLTKVYNKMTIEKKAQQYIENAIEEDIVVMMVFDIDDFKRINDTYGHPCGDQVLIHIAKVIKSQFKHTDLIGRIGGDEFCLVIKNKLKAYEEIEKKADKLLKEFKNIKVDNCEGMNIACSIGISIEESKKANFAYLYAIADEALYEAKKLGKNRYYMKDMTS